MDGDPAVDSLIISPVNHSTNFQNVIEGVQLYVDADCFLRGFCLAGTASRSTPFTIHITLAIRNVCYIYDVVD
jgi:hypothetical protein